MIPVDPRFLKNVESVTKIGFRSCSTHLVVDSKECFAEINDGYLRSIPTNGALKYPGSQRPACLCCACEQRGIRVRYTGRWDRFYALAAARQCGRRHFLKRSGVTMLGY